MVVVLGRLSRRDGGTGGDFLLELLFVLANHGRFRLLESVLVGGLPWFLTSGFWISVVGVLKGPRCDDAVDSDSDDDLEVVGVVGCIEGFTGVLFGILAEEGAVVSICTNSNVT